MRAPGSVGEALAAAVEALARAGVATPRLDAELLVASAAGVARGRLLSHPELTLTPVAARLVEERVARRVRREPVAYILARRAFRHIDLHVDRRVLVPRPETEALVEEALGLPAGARVHDVGTGSGAVALALKHERPDLRVSASDLSPDAVAVARLNARALGLDVAVSVARGLPPGAHDFVLANLPYVERQEWLSLEPELGYEPRGALDGGSDGLAPIRELLQAAPPGTRVALEHGATHGAAVRALLAEAATRRDLAGHERITVGRVP